MTFSETLARLRKKHGLSQYELARRLGFSRGQLANYEQGKREPDHATLTYIADFFEVTVDELLGRNAKTPNDASLSPQVTGQKSEGNKVESPLNLNSRDDKIIYPTTDGPSVKQNTKNIEEALKRVAEIDTDIVWIPVLGTIKAGFDLLADQQVIDMQPVQASSVADEAEYFFLLVKGDSMIDDGIREGMRVLVRRQNFVDEEGRVGVVIINGDEATLKRIYKDGDHVVLQSANPKYRPRVLPADEVRIIGQAIKFEGDL